MKFSARITWTNWYIGVWYWPVKKDRTFGIVLGPLTLMWSRMPLL